MVAAEWDRRYICSLMQRAFATSLIGLTLGWGGLYFPGYKPFVVESGYKPYVYTEGYKPYVTGKGGFKPYASSSSSSRKPIPLWDCESNGWYLMPLLGRDPLSFCRQIPVNAPGALGTEWLSL